MALGTVSSYGIVLRDRQLPVLKLHSTGPRLRNQPKMPPIVFCCSRVMQQNLFLPFTTTTNEKGEKSSNLKPIFDVGRIKWRLWLQLHDWNWLWVYWLTGWCWNWLRLKRVIVRFFYAGIKSMGFEKRVIFERWWNKRLIFIRDNKLVSEKCFIVLPFKRVNRNSLARNLWDLVHN